MNELHFAGRNILRKKGGDVRRWGGGGWEKREIREKKTDSLNLA